MLPTPPRALLENPETIVVTTSALSGELFTSGLTATIVAFIFLIALGEACLTFPTVCLEQIFPLQSLEDLRELALYNFRGTAAIGRSRVKKK
jgi:hypothetical protein